MSNDATDTRRTRLVEGARNYAMADKSDPFCFARAMTHLNQGVVGYDADGNEAIYTADAATEMRPSPMGDNTNYPVTVYRNVKRP